MKMNVIANYDRLIQAYTQPKFTIVPKKDLVEEHRRAIVSDPQKMFALKDHELYYLGTYDDEKGHFELLDKPEFLARLEDFFPRKEVSKDGDGQN